MSGERTDEGRGGAGGEAPTLMLFTSLPIYWAEAPDFEAMLDANVTRHWARATLERSRSLRPLDTLSPAALNGERDLLMAQPRPLSPQENVALDAWVANGGRLLLFADPALTEDSAFPIGDRRRPQDIVLLSPILARWGLALEFDDEQRLVERSLELGDGVVLPVALPGRFAARAGGREDASCRFAANGVLADCRVGRGRVVALADAALLAGVSGEAAIAPRRDALEALTKQAFGK